MKAISITKFEEGVVNEDAAIATSNYIAVSDGAGGGGVFADKWSKYLIDNIPTEPIADYGSFDSWIDSIWEAFYNRWEEKAKEEGGLLLNKFYEEGSFATLVAVWNSGRWVSYGDSTAFCYDMATGKLQYSIGQLTDFNNPPYLVNCKDPTEEIGFKTGVFEISSSSIVFVASDALAHYILMMYEVAHKDEFALELQQAIDAQTKNSNFVNAALNMASIGFDRDIVSKLLHCSKNTANFKRHIVHLHELGLIAHDDYSFATFRNF
ncbi:MAG: hypothetical protein J6Y72_08870 [Bacteroidales bacterium]|nr:hypothetical protein [Bacteroidales bacterium]